jgi:hypothetical protein
VTANDPPLIAGVIHGVRVWHLQLDGRQARLAAAVQGTGWVRGGRPTRARCLGAGAHAPPAGDCGCGLYALHPYAIESSASFFHFPGYHRGALWIAGLVEAWGRVEIHSEGFRAEYARPLALLVMGLPRHGEYHDVAAAAAAAYRVDLLDLESPAQVVAHCRNHDLGLSREVVRSLLPQPPEESGEVARRPPFPPNLPTTQGAVAAPSRFERIGQFVADAFAYAVLGALTLLYVVFWATLAFGVVLAVLDGLSADAGSDEFSPRALRVVDERLVRFDGSVSYIAIVRNTSDDKVALAAFPRGRVLDSDGDEVVPLQRRERIDVRPSLGPGETGAVIDRLGRPRGVDVDRRLRYETDIHAAAERRPTATARRLRSRAPRSCGRRVG